MVLKPNAVGAWNANGVNVNNIFAAGLILVLLPQRRRRWTPLLQLVPATLVLAAAVSSSFSIPSIEPLLLSHFLPLYPLRARYISSGSNTDYSDEVLINVVGQPGCWWQLGRC
ncbi:hypothetical protein Ancab_014946 [Ancistrocladus abbreviatus]